MTKKLIIILVMMCAFAAPSFAQLSTGKTSAKKIRTGNRPEAGDFGLFVGASFKDFKDAIQSESAIPVPIVNLKYYTSDEFELRASIDVNAYNEKAFGKLESEGGKDGGARQANGQFLFVPGGAYHFSDRNILDVYAGFELPLGWTSDKVKEVNGDMVSTTSKSAFTIGLGAFVGLQAFVADLPVAIGLEYGFSSQFDLGLKYKNAVTTGGQTQVSYTPSDYFSGVSPYEQFSSLSARRGNLGQQVRIIISYYFQ